MLQEKKFDIALSFAGEDREYVDQVANCLKSRGIAVFYDIFEQVDLWGKNLYDHLSDVYRNKARFTLMFISKHYAEKLWTNHERQAAQSRAFQEHSEYILPVRFDDTEIKGVLPTVGYISLKNMTPEGLASLVAKKLVSAGGTIPAETIRRNFSKLETLPRPDPTELNIIVKDDEGAVIPNAKITAIAENGTSLDGLSDKDGITKLKVQTRRIYNLLVAHPDFPAALIEKVDPEDSIKVIMPRSQNIGSIIIHSTGYIPGLSGRLNPILDTSNSTYLYADNIAINGGVNQPGTFKLNDPVELEDANGNIFLITVKYIAGRTSLIQYLKPVYEEK